MNSYLKNIYKYSIIVFAAIFVVLVGFTLRDSTTEIIEIEEKISVTPLQEEISNVGVEGEESVKTEIPREEANEVIEREDAEDTENLSEEANEVIEREDAEDTENLPLETGIYFGAFADFGDTEDDVSFDKINDFQSLIQKKLAFAYFSDNWLNGIDFPHQEVGVLKSLDIVPYVRLMPRVNFRRNLSGSGEYTLERIANGEYDDELLVWATAARNSGTKIIIEFGTEVNGMWFPWNGNWNGGGETIFYGDVDVADGPERFINAYRNIIEVFNDAGADNIIWVYHVNAKSSPKQEWNGLMSYYPGDAYIDWVGISAYGAQRKSEAWVSFNDVFYEAYKSVADSTDKPIIVSEFGVSEGLHEGQKAEWLESLFSDFKNKKYDRVIALSYWHSSWEDENTGFHNLYIDSSTSSLSLFTEEIANKLFLSDLK